MAEVEIVYAYPASDLQPLVLAYWEIELGGGPVVDLLHPEAATIRVALSGEWSFGSATRGEVLRNGSAYLHGTTSQAQWVRGSRGRAFCIVLRPHAWSTLLSTQAWRHSDRLVPLIEVLGDRAGDLAHAIASAQDFAGRVVGADQILADWQGGGAVQLDPSLITLLDRALADPDLCTVKELIERLGMSQSRLARLAQQTHGFTPKLLIRRERFLRMLHIMEARPYADWRDFIDTQYVDQSHMIRDFKDFLGLAPSRYFALERPLLQAAFDGIRRLADRNTGNGLAARDNG